MLMRFPFYTGKPELRRPGAGAEVPGSRRAEQTKPEGYLADAGLVDAVNVALLLGQPLLLTGEPGTGKTQLAYSLAWELGLDEPLKFETKSTSTASDLFYTYNALGHFHAAQCGEGSRRALDYLTYNALGIAILRANDESAVRAYLPDDFRHGGRRRSVVLIDEIDKAPRDFPNDLLKTTPRARRRASEEAGHCRDPVVACGAPRDRTEDQQSTGRSAGSRPENREYPGEDRRGPSAGPRRARAVGEGTSPMISPTDLSHRLPDLIDELREAGYSIGIDQYVAAQDLLLALAGWGALPENVGRYRRLLGPIFCKSAQEQEDFRGRFDRWIARGLLSPKRDTSQELRRELNEVEQGVRAWGRILVTGSIAALILAIIANSGSRPPPDPPVPIRKTEIPTEISLSPVPDPAAQSEPTTADSGSSHPRSPRHHPRPTVWAPFCSQPYSYSWAGSWAGGCGGSIAPGSF
jgi:hypothetical protein